MPERAPPVRPNSRRAPGRGTRRHVGAESRAEVVASQFSTHEHHTEPEPGNVTTIHDPSEASERRERATA